MTQYRDGHGDDDDETVDPFAEVEGAAVRLSNEADALEDAYPTEQERAAFQYCATQLRRAANMMDDAVAEWRAGTGRDANLCRGTNAAP